MTHLKNVSIIAGKLSILLDGYIGELRHGGDGFQQFSDETIYMPY